MKRSIKIISILFIIGIIIIIISNSVEKNKQYYRNVADTIIGFYNSARYDKSSIKDKDLNAVKTYLCILTHIDEEICISDYIVDESAYKTDEDTSSIIYKKNGKCYVKYSDLNISKTDKSDDMEMESYDTLVCNGYYVILYKSMFEDKYANTIDNPKYNYVFESYNENNNTKEYTYVSSYDGTKVTVILTIENNTIISIETK